MSKSVFWLGFWGSIFLDQLSKGLIATSRNGAIVNQGISFGFRLGKSQELILILLGLVIFSCLAYFKLIQKKQGLYVLFWGVFLGSATSNLIDRLFFGGVRDWWDWSWFGFRNNLADVLIVLATAGILFFEIFWDNQGGDRKK